jgi:DNA-binding NarL/FixJ family response regulator
MGCRVAVVAASPLIGAGLVAALVEGSGWEVERFDSVDAALGGDAAPDVVVAALDAAQDATTLYDSAADRVRLVLLGDAAATLLPRAQAQYRAYAALSANATPQQVRAAVTAVLADLQLCDPAVAPRDAARPVAVEPPGEPLTPRELEVFELLAKGLRNRDIAAALGISEHTAKFHVGQILAKIGAATRAEAVGLGLKLGLIGV